MKRQLSRLLADPQLAAALSAHGRETILQRHTCAQRIDELLDIYRCIDSPLASAKAKQRPDEKHL
jgi:spore maturation protein CgeB